jgi:mono/diheme cytochrome c family protein
MFGRAFGLVALSLVTLCVVAAWPADVRAVQAAPASSVWAGVYTGEQASRGAMLYREACASCHGPTLLGGEMAPALVGTDFMSNWNGLSVGDLVERIRVSMPQNDPGSLSRQRTAGLVAYLLQANRFPPGQTELPGEDELLKQIKIEATKP